MIYYFLFFFIFYLSQNIAMHVIYNQYSDKYKITNNKKKVSFLLEY